MWFAPLLVTGGIVIAARSIYRRMTQGELRERADDRSPRSASNAGRPVEPGGSAESVTALATIQDQAIRDVSITALAGTTAVIHVWLGSSLFVLNGVGYAGLLAAHYLVPEEERYKQYTRDALFGYSGITIIGYFAVKGATSGFTSVLGMATKMDELGLMYMLWKERQVAKLEAEHSGRVIETHVVHG